MPTGLPFVSLDGYDGQFAPGTMARSLPQEEIEPGLYRRTDGTRETYSVDWSRFDGGGAPPALSQADPMAVLQNISKVGLDNTLSQSQAKRAALQKSIEPDITLLREKAQLDIEALRNEATPDAEARQKKEQRLKDLELSYRKKELDIRAKIRPDLDKLNLGEQEAKDNAALQLMTKQYAMGQIAAIGQEEGWSPYKVKQTQLKMLGITLPAERATTPLTPDRGLAQAETALRGVERALGIYTVAPATKGRWGKSATPERLMILKPQYRGISNYRGLTYDEGKDLLQEATPEEAQHYLELQTDAVTFAQQARQYRDVLTNRKIPTLTAGVYGTPSPVAQTVMRTVPEAPQQTTLPVANTPSSTRKGVLERMGHAAYRSGGGQITTAIPRIANDAEFDALPSGIEFIGPDGQRRRKP